MHLDSIQADRHVAVKILRNVPWYSKAIHNEIQVLQDLKKSDPNRTQHCVQMLEWFEYQGHVCIVFELLGLSTYDFIKGNCFWPFTLEHIRQMAYQICKSVNFLHQNKLIHTDLKPENILLVNSDYTYEYNLKLERYERRLKNTDIKVADFGSATYDDEDHSRLVSTRPYRAPEVILALGWSQSCDVWSIGCILIEYYLGHAVFGHRKSLGQKRRYFHRARLDSDGHRFAGRCVPSWCKPLKEFVTCQNLDHRNLFDLLQMLEYDPAKRITLEEALKHPFFSPLKRQKRKLPPVAEKADADVTLKRQKKY
uniref:dual-specificity kinase n=1 Tax=Athene cunicularia TaxID=194338 RepID=A0A663M611_ATHCN